ncbi:MAG: hypothetical protein KF724_09095 [Phycisphaeraceae bacterium]|nr:hypothetical protein [Phycisphaeraceae bacterium]
MGEHAYPSAPQESSEAPDAAAPRVAAAIRRAEERDLPALRVLLSERDHREWDQPSVDWFVCRLDPAQCLAWMAFAGERPVGLSSMYLRTLVTSEASGARGTERRAAYWANLYVDPAFRDQMLYPRLPLTMAQALRPAGASFLYAAVRQRDLAETHLRIGFARIGRMAVLFKPLRPARLLARHRGMGRWAELLGLPLDALWRLWLAARRPATPAGLSIESLGLDDPRLAHVVALLERGAPGDSGAILQKWTTEGFRARFERTREGGHYDLRIARRRDSIDAALLMRYAERGAAVKAAVVMTLAGESAAIAALLADAERRAVADGAVLMLFMDGLGPGVGSLLRRRGYRPSPETYDLIVWPKAILTSDPDLADLSRWRLSFADHDAF